MFALFTCLVPDMWQTASGEYLKVRWQKRWRSSGGQVEGMHIL